MMLSKLFARSDSYILQGVKRLCEGKVSSDEQNTVTRSWPGFPPLICISYHPHQNHSLGKNLHRLPYYCRYYRLSRWGNNLHNRCVESALDSHPNNSRRNFLQLPSVFSSTLPFHPVISQKVKSNLLFKKFEYKKYRRVTSCILRITESTLKDLDMKTAVE